MGTMEEPFASLGSTVYRFFGLGFRVYSLCFQGLELLCIVYAFLRYLDCTANECRPKVHGVLNVCRPKVHGVLNVCSLHYTLH